MILVSYFSEDDVLSRKIKICYIFEYQSKDNRAFLFFSGGGGGGGTPGIYTCREQIAITSFYSNGSHIL